MSVLENCIREEGIGEVVQQSAQSIRLKHSALVSCFTKTSSWVAIRVLPRSVRSGEDPVVPFLGLCSILACLAFISLEQLRIFIMTKLSLYLLRIQTFNLIYQLHRRVSPIWKPNILKIFQWRSAPLQFGNCWNFGKRGKIELRFNLLMWQCIR